MDHEPELLERINDAASETMEISKLISVKEFIARWRAVLTYDELTLQGIDSLPYKSVSGESDSIPREIWEELFIVTNPVESLFAEGMVPFKKINPEDIPSDVRLQTVMNSSENNQIKKTNYRAHAYLAGMVLEHHFKQDEHLSHKYAILQYERQNDNRTDTKDTTSPELRMTIPEAIITVNIHRPQSMFRRADVKRGYPNALVQIITHTSLVQLRDAIRCPKDFEIPGDFSLAPNDSNQSKRAKEIFNSALFFIEDTFYVDRRNLRAKDYSQPIIDWLRKKGLTQNFPVKPMNAVKMIDLKLRLGMPYVYIHQGNCEHVIQFTDIRLMHSEDCQLLPAYPLHLMTVQPRLTICNACQIRAVKWMVAGSALSTSDPAHYCDVCYKMLHYDSEGNKICDFQAYRYTDNAFASH